MINIKKLTKRFGEHTVFSDLDLCINKGEIVAIIGPSGTGKSTFLRCLNYLDSADSGTITINDIDVNCQQPKKNEILALRRQTGFVFQNYALFNHLTAQQNISEGLRIVKGLDNQQAQQRALSILTDIA